MTDTKPAAKPMLLGGSIRWLRIAGVGVFGLLFLAAVVLTWLINDPDRVRRAVESVVSAISDRPFTIEGEFNFELGKVITVRAGKIRWLNSPSSPTPYMLEIEQFTGSIDLLSLFDLPIVITDAQASNAKLLFEWDEGDGFNWRLTSAEDREPDNSEPPNPLPMVIDKASVQNVSIRFRHPALTGELEIIVQRAEHQQDEANRLVVSAAALLGERELSIDGYIGPFPELAVAGAVDFDVVIAGQLAKLTSAGNFASLRQLSDPKVVAKLSAPSATELAHRLKLPLETTGDVQLQLNIIGKGDGIAATSSGSFGEFEVDARFRSDSLKSLQGLDMAVRSDGPSIGDLATIAGLPTLPDTPYEFEARARRTERGLELQRFVLDTKGLNIQGSGIAKAMPELRDIDLELTAAGSNLTTVAALLNLDIRSQLPFRLNAAIASNKRGQNDAFDARLRLGGTTARVTGSISEAVDFSGSRLKFTVDAPDAAELAGIAGVVLPSGSGLRLRGSSSITAQQISFDRLRFTGQGIDVGGSLGFTGEGYSRIEFDLAASADKLADLVPASVAYQPADVPFRMTAKGVTDQNTITINQSKVRLGDARLALSGELQLRPTLAARAVRLTGSGPRLSDLGAMRSWRLTERPFEISATAQGKARELFIDDLQIASADNDLSGRLRYLDKPIPLIELSLRSNKLNLDEIRVLNPQEKEPVEAEISRDRLFSNDPLPFEVLDSFDASLNLQFDDLVIQERQLRNLIAEASLKDGMLEIPNAQVDTAKGKLKVRGTLKPAPAGRTIDAEIHAANAMIELRGMTQQELDQLPNHAIVSQLSATGSTARELATSLDGYAWIVGGQGKVPRSKLTLLVGDFTTELLSAVNPFGKTAKYSRIDCQGAYFEIENGKIETSPAIVIRTDQVLVLAEGKVDLVSEKIDFTFQTTPLRGVGVSLGDYLNPFTKVVGTLRSPRIAVNPKGAMIEGGAAVATYGLTILAESLWKRWFGSRQICEKVAEQAVKIRKERDPGSVPDLNELIIGTQPAEAPAVADRPMSKNGD